MADVSRRVPCGTRHYLGLACAGLLALAALLATRSPTVGQVSVPPPDSAPPSGPPSVPTAPVPDAPPRPTAPVPSPQPVQPVPTPSLVNPSPVPVPTEVPVSPPGPQVVPVPVPSPPTISSREVQTLMLAQGISAPRRFTFDIRPGTPVKELLPRAPKGRSTAVWTGDDLTKVPEVMFQEGRSTVESSAEAQSLVARLMKPKTPADPMRDAAHMIARINHLNTRERDGFMKTLVADRPDLAGLPLTMGDSCRTTGERSKYLTTAARTVRAILGQNNPTTFWSQLQTVFDREDGPDPDATCREHATLARIGILMQMLAPESQGMRLGLVKYLSGINHAEATRALAKLAIFSEEAAVRDAALATLKVRRERDYTAILVRGLRYPYPAVARHAADAIAKLDRPDLIPELLNVLDEPDPRTPKTDDKRELVVEELVRLNHHQSCVLCHAPGNTGKESAETLTAEVAVPGQPLQPENSGGYQNNTPDLFVRADVTYLRADFSVKQPVADAAPWPEMQRFDFVVRKRTLTEEEATPIREAFTRRKASELSPYHRAVLAALREMTGKDTEPTAAAWRKLLARAE
jgi:hypothetical protein